MRLSSALLKPVSTLLPVLLNIAECKAALYLSVEEVPTHQFDFIVVGGGTAGSVVASRLSEHRDWQVLLVEIGPSNKGVLESIIPYYQSKCLGGPYDHNYTTTPQDGLNGRTLAYARGHILGGSSSINGMFWTRGVPSDYDKWARITGDYGWSWRQLSRYIRKMENLGPAADGHNTTGQIDPSIHGRDGNIMVSLPGWPQETDSRAEEAMIQLGGDFRPVLDSNSENPLGMGWVQSTVGKGQRSSSATSYLGPSQMNRSNLHVVVNARVTKVIQDSRRSSSFKTIKVTSSHLDSQIRNRTFTAKKEVILAAGSVDTPRILLHSGIGDQLELQSLGIQPTVHLPSVGKNLTDHPFTFVLWNANSTTTGDALLNSPELQAEALERWKRNQTGPFTSFGNNQVAWVRIPADSPIWETHPDPTGNDMSPHMELVVSNSAAFTGLKGNFVGMGLTVMHPVSRGSITLQSSNLPDAPLINPNFFGEQIDIQMMVQAIRASQRFYSAPAWKGYVLHIASPYNPATFEDDDAVVQVLKDSMLFSSLHPVGTAAMSPRGASWGVVDPDLKVKGARGLRIVDASIMPDIPSAHTQFPVYLIAERASDLIKLSWRQTW